MKITQVTKMMPNHNIINLTDLKANGPGVKLVITSLNLILVLMPWSTKEWK